MIHKLASIFLAFQVLLSSLSFNLGLHFCGESLQSLSLFGAATPCEHSKSSDVAEEDKVPCPFHSQQNEDDNDDCCDDKQVKIEGQDIDTTIGSITFEFNPQLEFLAAYVVSLLNLYQAETISHKFHNYKPPLIQVDLPVFFQTFLI